MSNIAIATDTCCGMLPDEAEKYGVYMLPMPFDINGKTYHESVTLSQEKFYEFQENGADITTSQPAPAEVMDFWDGLLKDHDQIVYIPMSSGLSSSCSTAAMLAGEEKYDGKVFVVNNQRISVTQRSSVLDAKRMADKGWTAQQIKDELERTKLESSIYITVDTLKYLKKGGRITPAAAAVGTLLRVKPVLTIQGEKLDAYKLARTYKIAKQEMLAGIKKDIETRFDGDASPDHVEIAMSYTYDKAAADQWKQEVQAVYPDHEIVMEPLCLVIATHIGKGALAVTVSRKLHI
ncbi:MAG: DegV family protein [Lachnospiraceae bacterium]|jgi:DegV family protein with EDD domain